MRIGMDPEVAIVNQTTGIARSAHKFMGDEVQQFRFGTDDPDYDDYTVIGSEVERDGAAIEVRSVVESACRDNIIPYVAEALRQTHLKVDKWGKGKFALSTTPVYKLDKLSLTNPPEDVVEFGCRPDYDAYALEVKDPSCPKGDLRRFTGGHIHWSRAGAKNNIEEQAAMAILYDYFVVIPMVAILGEKFADGEAERREFYGQPGSFRFDDKLDKIEFRTLSGRLLLHPTLLYWTLGMMKSFIAAVSGGRWEKIPYKQFLIDNVIGAYAPELVHEVISSHDYIRAEKMARDMFKLLPTYKEDEQALANPMTGGGKGTSNPYFYAQSFEVFMAGIREGIMWNDDMRFNWGLYEDYEPKHHAYWGIQQAMVGLCDDDIFPFNAVLPKVWPTELIQQKPIYTHPLNGGAKKYVSKIAAGWLA